MQTQIRIYCPETLYLNVDYYYDEERGGIQISCIETENGTDITDLIESSAYWDVVEDELNKD